MASERHEPTVRSDSAELGAAKWHDLAGRHDALARAVQRAATGVQVGQSWNDALQLLIAAAERGWQPARSQLRALAAERAATVPPDVPRRPGEWRRLGACVELSSWLSPAPARTLRADPRVLRFTDFVPNTVCDWLIARSRSKLQRGRVRDSVGREEITTASRGSTLLDTDLVHLLVQARIAASCGLPLHHLGSSAVLLYGVGEQAARHFDFVDPKSSTSASVADRGERVITFLLHLNDDYAGGETEFPRLALRHKGTRREGLLFVNALPNGGPDRRTVHAGLAPTRGEKWLLSQFIRDHRVLDATA